MFQPASNGRALTLNPYRARCNLVGAEPSQQSNLSRPGMGYWSASILQEIRIQRIFPPVARESVADAGMEPLCAEADYGLRHRMGREAWALRGKMESAFT